MDLDEIELHDSRLRSMHVDYLAKSVLVELDFYPSRTSPERKSASILFEDVDSISHLADFPLLSTNASAGNINYWVPCINSPTYLYLMDGCLVVTARKISFTVTE